MGAESSVVHRDEKAASHAWGISYLSSIPDKDEDAESGDGGGSQVCWVFSYDSTIACSFRNVELYRTGSHATPVRRIVKLNIWLSGLLGSFARTVRLL